MKDDERTGPAADLEAWPLEPDRDAMRALLDEAAERVIHCLEELPDLPASDVDGGDVVAASVREDDWPSVQAGTTITSAEAFDQVFDRLAKKGFNHSGPGFMAYISSGGIFHAALAELVAATVNRYMTVWDAAPGLAQLEANAVRWICRMFGLPEGSGGYLSSGGSMANLSAVVAARSERLGEDFGRGTVYLTSQTHHSIHKATSIAGIAAGRLRTVAVDERYRMRPDDLAAQIEADRAAGLEPFLVVASAGTTDVGAVDPLGEIADVARGQGLWMHVDAAYGGFFALTERGRDAFAGIERADSITVDPHKGLFLPYGTGCLVVRDAATLRRSHAGSGDYMPALHDDAYRPDFCAISPELSRGNRGLRVWLPLKLLGVEPFRAALDEKLDLAHWATDELRKIEGIEIVAEPQLSIPVFRCVAPRLTDDLEATNDLNRRLLAAINRRRRIYISGTVLDGAFVLRMCILSHRTHRARLEMGLEDVRDAVAEILA